VYGTTTAFARALNATNVLGCENLGFPVCDYYNGAQMGMDWTLYVSAPSYCASSVYQIPPAPFTPVSASILSGAFAVSCSAFDASGIPVYNSYLLVLTPTTATSGSYVITTNTYQDALCTVLDSVTSITATYTLAGGVPVSNPILGAGPAFGINYLYTAKTVTAQSATFAAIAPSICENSSYTFPVGKPVDILVSGCAGLGILPSAACPTTYNVFQVGLTGQSLYFGGQDFTACSASTRKTMMTAQAWTPAVIPTTSAPTTSSTSTPTPTHSFASNLSANFFFVVFAALFALIARF